MKYFRNTASTISTRSAWPRRDGVHVIYVTLHFTHTNATHIATNAVLSKQAASIPQFLYDTQIVPLQCSYKGFGIHCCCWSRKITKYNPVPKLTFTPICPSFLLQTHKHGYSFCLLLTIQTCWCHHSGQATTTIMSWTRMFFNQWADILSHVPEQVLLLRRSKTRRNPPPPPKRAKTFTTDQVSPSILLIHPSVFNSLLHRYDVAQWDSKENNNNNKNSSLS